MDVCEICQDLGTTPLTIRLSSLRVQREECPSCQLLWDAATAVLGLQWDHDNRFLYLPPRGADDLGPLRMEVRPSVYLSPAPRRVVIQIIRKEGDAPRIAGELFVVISISNLLIGTTTPWPLIGDAFDVGESGSSTSTIWLAKKWMDECLSRAPGHEKCVPDRESESVLPARVLDVGSDTSEHIKLYISHDGETGKWIALSHCWGGMVPITTTTANLSQHLESIPHPLPRTFMDAVILTRMLGIRFLWIDSLCILQDSIDDWNTHAPHMASVYGQSYVTISADAAENSSVGFLDGAHRQRFKSRSVPFSGKGQIGDVLVRERGALAYELPYHDWPEKSDPCPPTILPPDHRRLSSDSNSDLPRSALSKRGWYVMHAKTACETATDFTSTHFAGPFRSAYWLRGHCTLEKARQAGSAVVR